MCTDCLQPAKKDEVDSHAGFYSPAEAEAGGSVGTDGGGFEAGLDSPPGF